MVYESEVSKREYPTVLNDKNLLAIYEEEILRLADGDSPFPDERHRHIEALRPKEKEKVYKSLLEERSKLRRRLSKAEDNLAKKIREFDSGALRTLAEEVISYSINFTRIEIGLKYLRSFPDFPKQK